MYIAELIDTDVEDRVFDCVSELVNYYHAHHKGDHLVAVFEAEVDATGNLEAGEYMFSFRTENYGDLH